MWKSWSFGRWAGWKGGRMHAWYKAASLTAPRTHLRNRWVQGIPHPESQCEISLKKEIREYVIRPQFFPTDPCSMCFPSSCLHSRHICGNVWHKHSHMEGSMDMVIIIYCLLQLHSCHKPDITNTENTIQQEMVSKPSARAVDALQGITAFPHGATSKKPGTLSCFHLHLTCLPWFIDGLVCLDDGAIPGLADQNLFLLLNIDPISCDGQFYSGNLLCAISWRGNLHSQREESSQAPGNLLTVKRNKSLVPSHCARRDQQQHLKPDHIQISHSLTWAAGGPACHEICSLSH